MEIGLSLGSNAGDRPRTLQAARRRIAALPGVVVLAASPIYETEPVGVRPEYADRPFLNAVLIVDAAGELEAFARALQGLEDALGRRRDPDDRNAPRVIDIDVIYAGAQQSARPALHLPHPRWAGRRFVVQPLADVRPAARLPGERRTVREVLADLPETPGATVWARDW